MNEELSTPAVLLLGKETEFFRRCAGRSCKAAATTRSADTFKPRPVFAFHTHHVKVLETSCVEV